MDTTTGVAERVAQMTNDGPNLAATAPHPSERQGRVALAVVRILLGFVFLWAFLDKAFGLGFGTPRDAAWVTGASPTSGFLGHLEGTFAGTFGLMAGQAWVDWAFMGGMLLVGGALMLGVALWPAALGAVLMMGLLWLASIPLQHNPVVDEHLVYAALAVALAATRAGDTVGLGRWWRSLDLVPGWRWLS